MKNKFSSFERHFKMEKNVVFLFMVSFAVLEIFTILYYANKITDDVTTFSQCGAKAQNERYLQIMGQYNSSLARVLYPGKYTTWYIL